MVMIVSIHWPMADSTLKVLSSPEIGGGTKNSSPLITCASSPGLSSHPWIGFEVTFAEVFTGTEDERPNIILLPLSLRKFQRFVEL